MNQQEQINENLIARLLQRIFNALLVGIVAMLSAAFGAGVFFAQTTERLESIEGKLSRVTDVIIENIQERIRTLEHSVAAGVLPKAEHRIDKLEKRVQTLERTER